MEDIEKAVLSWHKETFGWATVNDIKKKFDEESLEFDEEYYNYGAFSEQAAKEFADKVIVYMSGLAKSGQPTLSQLIREKLEINKKRKWNTDGTRDKYLPTPQSMV